MTKTATGTGVLDSKLTLRGVTLPVKFNFTVNRVGVTVFSFETIAGFSGRTELERTKFGMTAFPKAVGTEVTIRLEIEAALDRDAEHEYRQAVEKTHAAAKH